MIVFTPTDAKRIISLLGANCQELIFPVAKQSDINGINAHLEQMIRRLSTNDLHVTCRFETIPGFEATIINIRAEFVQREEGKHV